MNLIEVTIHLTCSRN
uniref:Uncharacterized protein n=1 Tax=Arundo donax TaxID=35708 RepID=A0A0A8YX58_ARUDO